MRFVANLHWRPWWPPRLRGGPVNRDIWLSEVFASMGDSVPAHNEGDGRLVMKRHYIHYNRREIRLRFPSNPEDPWFSELQTESDGFNQPRYHVTRAIDGPASEVGAGDTIWLVGQLYAPWGECFPPTLDAKIVVASADTRNGNSGIRYAAADTSYWFALTNATEHLRALKCKTTESAPSLLWKDKNRSIGNYLERLRELANGEILEDWEVQQQSMPLQFVSYRIRDGSRLAFQCARTLFDEGKRLFWDRWSLPRRLAERREAVGDKPLDERIESSIKEAEVVWGIESPLYGAMQSYSARERDLAITLKKYRPFAVL